MSGQEKLKCSLVDLPDGAIVCDIVYNPLKTDLLRDAEDKGNITVSGLGMLLHQARPAFQEWFGILPDITDGLLAEVMKKL